MPLKTTGPTPKQMATNWRKIAPDLRNVIANTALNFFLMNFRLQGFMGNNGLQKWPARSPDAVRNKGRALLVDRGTLRQSLTKYVSANSIKVFVSGPAEKYAAIHNTGGVTHPTVTPAMRGFFWQMYKATGNVKYKNMALTTKTHLDVHIPQRKFIGNSTKLNGHIATVIVRHMKKITEMK